ncbi:hypothetical protein AAFC00_005448 [Neodothiora populina]|uniref:Mannan endo-1,6-alpha-mannosidase n=1 Tax=Neodothiora populina TaxID=2781224 RepID=A0ABR3PL38_9PEZI
MYRRVSDRLASAVSLLCFSSLLPQLSHALTIDVTNSDSIKAASSQVAYGMMKYYTGNHTGDVPGNLPAPYYWWEAGAMFGHMVEYWYYTGDTTYNEEVTQALQHQIGDDSDFMPANQSKSLGNDDQMFWAFAAMSAAELNYPNPPDNEPGWLALAQAVFNEQALRWDTLKCNGGLRWQIFTFNAGFDYKNTISNGGFFQLAARLARYTDNSTYSDWAEKTWDWFEGSVLFDQSKWQVNDGTSTDNNCSDADQLQWSYNYGTFLVGMAFMYNHTNGSDVWYNRLEGLLNTTLTTFFPANMGDMIMVEITCEPLGNCNNDQRSFKSFLSRWLALTAQLVPPVYDRIFAYLRKSAIGAAGQCDGGTDGITCGHEWNTTTWDGTYGVGEQMCAMAVINTILIDTEHLSAPYSNSTGGTSKGNPTAGSGTGSGGSGGGGSGGRPSAATSPITTGDKAGAGIITAIILFVLIIGSWWLLFVE